MITSRSNPFFVTTMDCFVASLLAMTKKRQSEETNVSIGKARRSRLSPQRRTQSVGLPRRGLRAADTRRGPGPAAHHLAVARSLYARADELRPALCGSGAYRRRDGKL